MVKGSKRIIAGAVLIALQIISIIGTYAGGNKLSFSGSGAGAAFDIGFMLGYFAVGIIGVVLLIWGLIAKNKH